MKTVEGNLEEIEELLWEKNFSGRNLNACYLYSFKEECCHCVVDDEGIVISGCYLEDDFWPMESIDHDPDIIIHRDYPVFIAHRD